MTRFVTYQEERVLGRIEGKLYPNFYFPDISYILLLTQTRMYMLEPDYQGAYTERLALPLGQVLRMKYLVFQQKRTWLGQLLFNVLSGLFLAPDPDAFRGAELDILLEFPPGSSHQLRFQNLSQSPKDFTRLFEQIKRESPRPTL